MLLCRGVCHSSDPRRSWIQNPQSEELGPGILTIYLHGRAEGCEDEGVLFSLPHFSLRLGIHMISWQRILLPSLIVRL